MAKIERADVKRLLADLFRIERDCETARDRLLRAPSDALIDALMSAYQESAKLSNEDESNLRAMCIAGLLREIPGPRALDFAIDILGCDFDEVRETASSVLVDRASMSLPEVLDAIDRAIKRLPETSQALAALPFAIMNMDDADTTSLLRPFLSHASAEVVASAIEVLAEKRNPDAIPLLETMVDDTRSVETADEDGHEDTMRIGTMAVEVIDALKQARRIMSAIDAERGN